MFTSVILKYTLGVSSKMWMVSLMPKSGGGGGGTSAKPASRAQGRSGNRNAVRRGQVIDQDRQRRKLLRDDVQ